MTFGRPRAFFSLHAELGILKKSYERAESKHRAETLVRKMVDSELSIVHQVSYCGLKSQSSDTSNGESSRNEINDPRPVKRHKFSLKNELTASWRITFHWIKYPGIPTCTCISLESTKRISLSLLSKLLGSGTHARVIYLGYSKLRCAFSQHLHLIAPLNVYIQFSTN